MNMYENEVASRLESLFARALKVHLCSRTARHSVYLCNILALKVQLSDSEQDVARTQLEIDAATCR